MKWMMSEIYDSFFKRFKIDCFFSTKRMYSSGTFHSACCRLSSAIYNNNYQLIWLLLMHLTYILLCIYLARVLNLVVITAVFVMPRMQVERSRHGVGLSVPHRTDWLYLTLQNNHINSGHTVNFTVINHLWNMLTVQAFHISLIVITFLSLSSNTFRSLFSAIGVLSSFFSGLSLAPLPLSFCSHLLRLCFLLDECACFVGDLLLLFTLKKR